MIKKKIYRIGVVFLTIVSLSGLTSCNDWLDVKPKTEEEAASLFATLDGFKSALQVVISDCVNRNYMVGN